MHQAYCKHFYNTMLWLGYATHVCNLLGAHFVDYTDVSIWIPGDSLLDDPIHLSAGGARQFSQCFGRLLGFDTAILLPLSVAGSKQGSPRP
jgi:hypothetical protein